MFIAVGIFFIRPSFICRRSRSFICSNIFLAGIFYYYIVQIEFFYLIHKGNNNIYYIPAAYLVPQCQLQLLSLPALFLLMPLVKLYFGGASRKMQQRNLDQYCTINFVLRLYNRQV